MKSKNLAFSSVFLVLMILGTYVKMLVPVVPITFQPLFAVLTGLVLGKKHGALTITAYIALGLIGLPVFSGGGGVEYIYSPTFGFILGFLLCAFGAGAILEILDKTLVAHLISAIVGVVLIYIVGIPYLYFIQNVYNGATRPFFYYIAVFALPYLPKDVLSAIVAGVLAHGLSRSNIFGIDV
ncbi:MAG: biotin transporter BioY [Lachnospirales bacterium]